MALHIDIEQKTYSVNLADKNQPYQQINLGAVIHLPVQEKFFGLVKQTPKGNFEFKVELIDADGLTLSSTEKPFLLSVQGKEWNERITAAVSSCDVPMYVSFNPNAVMDCPVTIREKDVYRISFGIAVKDPENKEEEYLGVGSIQVHIEPFRPEPLFRMELECAEMVYTQRTGQANIPIGILYIEHNSNLKAVSDIDGLYFNLRTVQASSNLPKEGVVALSDVSSSRAIYQQGAYFVTDLKVGEKIALPFSWNMNRVSNPEDDETEYAIEVSDAKFSYDNYSGISVSRQPSVPFRLKRNKTLTRLEAIVSYFSTEEGRYVERDIANDRSDIDLGLILLSANNNRDEESYVELQFVFRNSAEAEDGRYPDAAVILNSCELVSGSIKGKERITLRKNKRLEEIFAFRMNRPRALKFGEEKVFTITINESDIQSIKPTDKTSSIELEMKCQFDMFVDTKGMYYNDIKRNSKSLKLKDGDEFESFSRTISLRLMKMAEPEWLSVDFGTSAVVAAYTSALDINHMEGCLIDLKLLKQHLLQVAITDVNKRGDANDEVDYLITSTACLNMMNKGNFRELRDDAHYMEYALLFSPSEEIINKEYQLPCLKTLMGYTNLPNIFTSPELFKYGNEQGEVRLKENEENTELMKVDVIFQLIYRQLFHHYLTKVRKDKNIQKLVLSIPNTYTPIHIRMIRDIARQALPSLYPEHLYTVSESDAVACYYIANQNRFFKYLSNPEEETRLRQQERVLVFDMGAGTLDLTYFKKTCAEGCTTVELLGKMGVSKAGNFLDYQLADILTDLCKRFNVVKPHVLASMKDVLILDQNQSVSKGIESSDRIEFKMFVKKTVKPLLNDPDAIFPDFVLKDQTIPLSASAIRVKHILTHPIFEEFIKDVTEKVLLNFVRLFGQNGRMNTDVVIFSGRSICLKAIRDGVVKQMRQISPNTHLYYVDICGGSMTDEVDTLMVQGDYNKLKTVVTYGALAYASRYNMPGSTYSLISKPLYAQFGVVLHNTNPNFPMFIWQPLIGGDMPVKEEKGIIESEECRLQLNDVTSIDLIQSYSTDVVKDYEDGNKDMIAVLTQVDVSTIGKEYPVSLTYYDQNLHPDQKQFIFKVGGRIYPIDPHDDFNNDSLRKSLWPVTFSFKKKEDN
ncbi:hypothetical protein [Phocaeicola barnesiae]